MHSRLNPKGIQFTKFFVEHDRSPVRVTTDSILLGAWSPIKEADKQILDLGTGCGVIAMMLAQRTESRSDEVEIYAIDIDERAYWQAKRNIALSPFPDINVICRDFLNYASDTIARYDLVVSSPPYFKDITHKRPLEQMSPMTARQVSGYVKMNHINLLSAVKKVLKPNGRFCVVLSHATALKFKKSALLSGWYCGEHIGVRYFMTGKVMISMLELSLSPLEKQVDIFAIRDSTNKYSSQFIDFIFTQVRSEERRV